MASEVITRLYWAVGRGRDLPGDQSRRGLVELVNDATEKYAAATAAPTTSVTLAWMQGSASMIRSTYLGMLNNARVVADIVDAERDGYDVALIGPNWDPGLREARGAVNIPVAGGSEAAMTVARTLGSRFAYLTVEGYGHFISQAIRAYGNQEFVIGSRPVREFLSLEDLYVSVAKCVEGTSDQFLVLLEKFAKECIADGAEVIIAGGQFFGPALVKHKFNRIPGTSVPVLDSTACGIKMAEMFAGLRKATGVEKSQHSTSPYRTPPSDALDKARQALSR